MKMLPTIPSAPLILFIKTETDVPDLKCFYKFYIPFDSVIYNMSVFKEIFTMKFHLYENNLGNRVVLLLNCFFTGS